MNIGTLRKVKITVVIENTVYTRDLVAEHGLSLYIEATTESRDIIKILFDTGQSAVGIMNNIKTLDIPIEELDYIIISHGHYDHIGGLTTILEQIDKPIKVIGHKYMFYDKIYKYKDGKIRRIGAPFKKSDFDRENGRFIPVSEPLILHEGIGIVTEIPTIYPFEIIPNFITKLPSGEEIPTHIEDVALVLNVKSKGAIILTGCGHAGILNTIKYAKETFDLKTIHSAMGGFHLRDAPEYRLEATVSAFKKFNVREVYPMHCTGIKAITYFKQKIPKNTKIASTGSVIDF
ncbi:MAG: MBL fold metallo-hydrolase [Candidatus Asgardarchaeia archaeon]